MNPGRARIRSITFRNGGAPDSMLRIWSGDTLMDLERNEALKMIVKNIDGTDYLFVEDGGFSTRHPADRQSTWSVLKGVSAK